MDIQENQSLELAQEANESSSALDEKQLENVTGGILGSLASFIKKCISCGKPTSRKVDTLQDPDLARNHQGTPLTYDEAHAEFREKYPVGHGLSSPYRVIPDRSLTIKGEPVGRIVPRDF